METSIISEYLLLSLKMELIKEGEYDQLSNPYNQEYKNYYFIQYIDQTKRVKYVGVEKKPKVISKHFKASDIHISGFEEDPNQSESPIFVDSSNAKIFKTLEEANEFYNVHGLIHNPGYSIKLVADYFEPIIKLIWNKKNEIMEVTKGYRLIDSPSRGVEEGLSKFFDEEIENFNIDTEFDKFEARFKEVRLNMFNSLYNKIIALQQIKY